MWEKPTEMAWSTKSVACDPPPKVHVPNATLGMLVPVHDSYEQRSRGSCRLHVPSFNLMSSQGMAVTYDGRWWWWWWWETKRGLQRAKGMGASKGWSIYLGVRTSPVAQSSRLRSTVMRQLRTSERSPSYLTRPYGGMPRRRTRSATRSADSKLTSLRAPVDALRHLLPLHDERMGRANQPSFSY